MGNGTEYTHQRFKALQNEYADVQQRFREALDAGRMPSQSLCREMADCASRYEAVKATCGYLRSPCRIWTLPVVSLGVLAGQQVTIRPEPQYEFLPEVFVVPSEIAPFFTIDEIKVGTQAQLLQDGAQAASVFSEASQNNIVNYDPVGPGRQLVVVVTNTDGIQHDFRASFFGRTLKD